MLKMSLNFNIIKLDEQAEKLIKLNFRMANLNANMVTVNKKTDRTSASLPKFTNKVHIRRGPKLFVETSERYF